MTGTKDARRARFDRTVRAVMWMDAALSIGLVLVCAVASPILATLGVPGSVLAALGLSALVCAVLLAAFGAITAALLMMRMQGGDYQLPERLRLPLPAVMRPSSLASSHDASSR